MINSKLVLIADDDESLVDVVARHCEACGLRVARAYDGRSALWEVEDFQPDLMILDVNMPCGSGLSVCEMVSRDLQLKSIPVIMLTGRKDDETIRLCTDLRAYYVPKGPDIWFRLEPLVMGLLGLDRQKVANSAETHVHSGCRADKRPANPGADDACPTPKPLPSRPIGEPRTGAESPTEAGRIQQKYIDVIFTALGAKEEMRDELTNANPQSSEVARPWVLCVDDDCDFADSLKLRLQEHGVEVVQAFAGMAGYRTAFTSPAQAIILDQQLPDCNGEYVLWRLKENPVTRDIPVIVLTGTKDRMLERKMYNLGAVRFFTKPVAWEDLWVELQRHIRLTPQPTLA